MKLNKNQKYSLCLIVFACVMIYASTQIQPTFKVSNGDIGPKVIPIAAAVGLILCSIGKFVTEAKKEDGFLTKEGWKRFGIVILILAVYMIAIPWIGYFISTLLATGGLTWSMKEDRKLSIVNVCIFSAVTTALLYFAFTYAMDVVLPAGRIFS